MRLEGIIPGSGSGSEPAAWQRELEQLGGRGGVGHALHVLQNLYTDHWQNWYSWTASNTLSFVPQGQDPQLVSGAALARAGRTTAGNFAKLKPEDIYAVQQSRDSSWVAFANTAAVSPLNRSLALQVLQTLSCPDILNARSLAALFSGDGNLCLQALSFTLETSFT